MFLSSTSNYVPQITSARPCNSMAFLLCYRPRITAASWTFTLPGYLSIIMHYFQTLLKVGDNIDKSSGFARAWGATFWQINEGACYLYHIDFYYIIKDNCFKMGKLRDVLAFKDNLLFMNILMWCLTCEKLLSFVSVLFLLSLLGTKKSAK